MAMMFLVPPSRRPYELYYFCKLSNNVLIVVDKESYATYVDYYNEEFGSLNYQYYFVPVAKTWIGKFLRGSSTAALVTYDDAALARIICDKKVETLVTVEASSSLSAQASRLCSKFSLRHIVIVWDNITRSAFSYIPPYSIYSRLVRASASKFVAVSSKSKDALISWRTCEDKIETVNPGIFVEKFKPSADSADKILFVGSLEPHKGVHILLNAFKKLSTNLSNVELILVGSGSLEKEIIKLRDSGVRIDFRSYFTRSKIRKVYSECSIFCSPSLKWRTKLIITGQEQFGFTLVEAMASGLPIVTSDIGTIPEVVGRQNLVVTPRVDNVFAALYKLITSDDLRKELRKNNRLRSLRKYDAMTQSAVFKKAIET